MSERETPQAIHDRAIAWVARLDRAGDDPATQAELDEWLAGDERRRGALFRAQVTWAMLDRASVLRGGRQDEARADPEYTPEAELEEASGGPWLSRRRMLWGGGAAAAGLVAGLSGIAVWPQPAERIETAIGEIRRVPLSDGSLAAVNTQTRLAVSIDPEVRRIALDEGEAWFQVEHDPTRPFIVEAGEVRVRAVGTAFSVRRTDTGAEVQVTEGTVEVWNLATPADVRRVGAGMRTFASYTAEPATAVEASGDIDRTLAWRTGQIVLDGGTVAEAVAEFNRYNRVKVEVTDPALAGERMIGRFRTNEPDAFARAAASLLNARVQTRGDRIVLSPN